MEMEKDEEEDDDDDNDEFREEKKRKKEKKKRKREQSRAEQVAESFFSFGKMESSFFFNLIFFLFCFFLKITQ